MNNRQGNNNQRGQGNRRNEAAQERMRFFGTSSSISGTGNNNAAMFFDSFSSPVVGPSDNREASTMLPINNNNAASEIIRNSSPSILPTTEQTNQPASNLLTLQRSLRINTANNNNQQDGVPLGLSLHHSGGDGGGSSSTIAVTGGTGGATEQGGGGGRDGLSMSVPNTTSTRRIMPGKRTVPDYRREFTVGESSSAAAAAGGYAAQPMAGSRRRPTTNENGVVRISSSSSSSTCTCTPNPTCPLHGPTNNNPSSSSREQHHETTNNNNNNHLNVVRAPSSSWSISEVQRALQSDSFQALQPTTIPPPPPPNNNNNDATLDDILQLDDGSFVYRQPLFDSSHHLLHHHHHHLHHGHQRAPINSFHHHHFSTADTPTFGPASMNYLENIPHHQPYAGSSSSSAPSPLPWTTVIRPRAAVPSLSLPHRAGASNSEANNITRNNNLSSSTSGRGIVSVNHNRGNSSSLASLVPSGSLSSQLLLESLIQNAGSSSIPSSGSGAAQNNGSTTVGAVPAFQHLSNLAPLWIQRLNAHDETLTRMSSSSTTDNTQHRALRASAIAESYNLPTYFADDSRRLRREIRTAIEHLRNGGSVRLEELLILDYSIVLNLLNSIEEEDDADPPQYEALGDGQRVTNPDVGLTETEVAACIGREIFQTASEQPQNTDACGICQEDYVHGEELGRLDCAHRYHLACIRRWLLIKNRCPVCKQMAITIIDLDDDEDDEE